jgi:hypothetical protein
MTEDLLPSTCPGGGTRMLHVTTNGYGGMVQVFGKPGTGPTQANFSVWVFPQRQSPVNELVVYGTDEGYNDFYVALASVTATT